MWCEARFGRAQLLMGAQLSRSLLKRGFGVRVSGEDFRIFFYQLQAAPSSVRRNAGGTRFDGAGYEELGAVRAGSVSSA